MHGFSDAWPQGPECLDECIRVSCLRVVKVLDSIACRDKLDSVGAALEIGELHPVFFERESECVHRGDHRQRVCEVVVSLECEH